MSDLRPWFETRGFAALLTMRPERVASPRDGAMHPDLILRSARKARLEGWQQATHCKFLTQED
jgi:hypothetical protein